MTRVRYCAAGEERIENAAPATWLDEHGDAPDEARMEGTERESFVAGSERACRAGIAQPESGRTNAAEGER